jgi:predicted DNA-binding transcriptional regulator YafY
VGVIIDRFGKGIIIQPVNDNEFTVNVNVAVSTQFLGWIFALGKGVKIVAPDDVVAQMKQEAERLVAQYK